MHALKIYTIENENYEPLFWISHGIFITYEFFFMKIMVWNVILP